MADTLSVEARSRLMAKVKGRGSDLDGPAVERGLGGEEGDLGLAVGQGAGEGRAQESEDLGPQARQGGVHELLGERLEEGFEVHGRGPFRRVSGSARERTNL